MSTYRDDASWADDRMPLMEEYESDTDLVAARVLGREAASVVSSERAQELGALLRQNPIEPRNFEVSRDRRTSIHQRTARIDALNTGVADVVGAEPEG